MAKVIPFFSNSLILLWVVIALTGCQPEAAESSVNQQAKAVAVDAVEIKSVDLQLTTILPGRTSAYRVAEVRPQVQGIIIKRLFIEGSSVKKGDLLFQIDPATYQVALESANADLASAQATLESADLQAKRYFDLVAQHAISQQDYEDAHATYQSAAAAVMSAKASVKSARINLGYAQIKAPISGRIGRSFVSEGALVTANQSDYLATIQQLDPLYVDISQPSNDFIEMRQKVGKESNKLSGIKITLDDGTEIAQQASLQFTDISVNETTGTVNVRAILANPDNILLPGMYVRADLPTELRKNAILVPQAAVSRDSTGKAHVMVVNKQNQVEDRTIITSRVVAGSWLIDADLEAGEKVIISGLQKITAGATVQLNNDDSNKG